MNITGQLSEQSQGGITSKRSHKHLLDSAQPVLSKQDSDSQNDEPADPMLDDPRHEFKMQNTIKQTPSRSVPAYELDLQAYNTMR